MALSQYTVPGDGVSNQVAISFPLGYLSEDDIKVRVNGETDGGGDPLYRTLTFITPFLVSYGTAAGVGEDIEVTRTVDVETLAHDFEDGAGMTESNLDDSHKQVLMAVHQVLDGRFTGSFSTGLDLGNQNIINMADGVNPQDGATVAQVLENSTKTTADAIATAADRVQTGLDAAATAADATATAQDAVNTALDASNAASSAAAAQSAVDSVAWQITQVTFADSPVTATPGRLYSCDTSGGPVVVNLPSINVVGEPTDIAVKKVTGDINLVTVNPNGTDTIQGDTNLEIGSVGTTSFHADDLAGTDNWEIITTGGGTASPKKDVYVAGTDFTTGTTTVLTLTSSALEAGVIVFFDGIAQHQNMWSLSGSTVTFTSVIPLGVKNIEIHYAEVAQLGVPADKSVTTPKVEDLAITLAKLETKLQKGIATARVTCDASGIIIGGFGVSSITDDGAGIGTVNFTTPMPDTGYTVASSVETNSGMKTLSIRALTASSFQFYSSDNGSDTTSDAFRYHFVVYGN